MSDLPPDLPPDAGTTAVQNAERKRLRGFLSHLIGYFGVMILLLPVNFLLTPDYPWFVLPLVAWGAPLAIHAAYAMGLFDRWRR